MTPSETGGRPAAFFDLDGTLIRGSVNIPLALAAFRRGAVPVRQLARDLLGNAVFMLTGASDDRAARVRERILAAVAGHPAAEVQELGEDFLDDAVASIDPVMRQRLEAHHEAGHDTVLVSASPIEIIAEFAERAGMTAGLGTVSEVDAEGRYTGRLEGPFCYREGKLEHIAVAAAEHGWDLAQSWAYSDSESDLPMLEAARHPVVVNPDRALAALARERGWEVLMTDRSLRLHPRRWLRRLLRREEPGADATTPG